MRREPDSIPSDLEAIDIDGCRVNLRGLARDRAVVLVFLRHFG